MKHECQRPEAEWASKNELLVLKEYTEGHERSDFEHGYSILNTILATVFVKEFESSICTMFNTANSNSD